MYSSCPHMRPKEQEFFQLDGTSQVQTKQDARPISLRATWTVTAGSTPMERNDKCYRRWTYTSEDLEQDLQQEEQNLPGRTIFNQRCDEANDYALRLCSGRGPTQMNWVRVDYLWY